MVAVTLGLDVPGPGNLRGPLAAEIWKIAAITRRVNRTMSVMSVNRRTDRRLAKGDHRE